MNSPYNALAANLYKFGVIDDTPHPGPVSAANQPSSTTLTNRWLQALLTKDLAKRPIQFVPQTAPDKPENAALHTAAQKTLHYTVNALLFNLECKLVQPLAPDAEVPNRQRTGQQLSAGGQDAGNQIRLLTTKEEAALYWLSNQLIQKSITRTIHPIFTYRDNNGEIKHQKHYNQLNSCLKRLKGVITASRLTHQTTINEAQSQSPDEVAQAINALRFPSLQDLAKAEEAEWREKAKTQEYNEIFLDLNPVNPFNTGSDSAEDTVDRTQPNELEGFRTDEIVRYHVAKRQQKTNPEVNNLLAWTLADQPPSNTTPALEETKRYVWEKAGALLQKAEQTPGIGFQLPEARWSGTRNYALPHALRRMYDALDKQNQDLAELDPSPEVLEALQHEHFSLGIAKACERTTIPYTHFKTAWDKQLEGNPNIIQNTTRPEAILKVLKQIDPRGDTAQKLRFLEEFAVTGGYCIEISPKQQQYREQITDILANSVSEIQLQRLNYPGPTKPGSDLTSPAPQKGSLLEPILRTPISGILRREVEANVRALLRKDLEADPQLKEALCRNQKDQRRFARRNLHP